MSEAEFILTKWADRQGWDLDSQRAVLLSFIDELGADAVGLLDRHLATIVRQEDDRAGPPVKGQVSSDDDVRHATFDAAPWLAQASDQDIRALAACGWGGDYPADAVAEWSSRHSPDVHRLFCCLNDANGIREAGGLDPIGFECHVDEGEALAWLKEHRPALHAELARASWAEREDRGGGPELCR